MPKLFITNNFLYLNKRFHHKNDDPQQSNIFIKNANKIKYCAYNQVN